MANETLDEFPRGFRDNVDWEQYPGTRFRTVETEGELDERARALMDRARKNEQHKGRVKELLKPYKEYRESRGEKPFQHLDGQRRLKRAKKMDEITPRLAAMFSGVDKMAEAIDEDDRESFEAQFRDAPDPEAAKMQAANKLAVEALTGKPLDEFGDEWNVMRSQVAQSLWNTRGIVSEKEFYSLAGKHYKKEKEKVDERQRKIRLAERVSEIAFKEAMRGRDFFEGSKAAKEKLKGIEGLSDDDMDFAMRVFREANKESKKRLGDVPDKARRAFQYLARRAGKETEEKFKDGEAPFKDDSEFADWAMELPPDEFEGVLQGISILGEENDKFDGFMMNMGRAIQASVKEFGEAMYERSPAQLAKMRREVENSLKTGEPMRLMRRTTRTDDDGRVVGTPLEGALKPVDLSREEKTELLSNLNKAEKAAERLTILRAYQSSAAPTTTGTFLPDDVELGLYDAARSGLFTAAALTGPVGFALNAKVMARQNESELILKHPEMDAVTRGRIAATAGVLQSAEETVLTRFAFGKMPGLRKAFKNIGVNSKAARFGINLAAGTAAEMFEEKLQEATLPAVQEILTALNHDAPNVDWEREWKEISGGNARLFFAVLPMTLIGAGVATHADISGYRQLTEDRKMLKAAKLSDEDIEKIVSESDLEARDELIQNAFQSRDQRLMKDAGFTEEAVSEIGGIKNEFARHDAIREAELQEAAAHRAMFGQTESVVDSETGTTTPIADPSTPLNEEMNFWEDLDRRGVLPEIRKEGQWYRVTTPDGDIENFESLNEAAEWSQGWLQSLKETPGMAAREYAAFLEEVHGNAETKFEKKQPTLVDRVEAGTVSMDLAEARARLAGIDDVSRAHVFGENRLQGRAQHARMMVTIFRDGDPLTVGEEFAEGFLKRHFAEGTEDSIQVEDMIRRYEGETGRKYLPDDPESLPFDQREQGVIEAFSSLGTEYLAGNLDARTLPEKLKQWFELLFDTVLSKVMEGARTMRTAQEQGKLDSRLESLLAEAMGVSEAPLRRAMEAEMKAEAESTMTSIAQELKGKLPHPKTMRKNGDPMAGEAMEIYEALRADRSQGASQAARTRKANQFFLPEGQWVDPDQVRESANEVGFDLDTPGEMWQTLLDEVAHGRAVHIADTGVAGSAVGPPRNRAEQERFFRRLEAQLQGDKRQATPATRAAARSAVSQPEVKDAAMAMPAAEGSTVSGNQGLGHVKPSMKPLPAIGKPVSAPEVMSSLTGVLRVLNSRTPIRVGRVRRGALGLYFVRERLIRLRTANSITTAAHEVAHAMEDAMLGRGHNFGVDKTVPDAAKKELFKIGKALYGDKKPAGGYHSEGFAEFFRMMVEGGHQNAKKHAPEFSKWFEAKVLHTNPKLSKAIDATIEATRKWNSQGALTRAKKSIAPTETKIDRAREAGLRFVRTFGNRFIDMAFPLKKFTQEAEARGTDQQGEKVEIPPGENPWDTLNARRMTADGVTKYMVERGMIDFYGNRVGKSLQDIVAPIKKDRDDFLIYLWAKRTVALEPSGRDSGLSPDDAAFIISELENPRFEKAAEEIHDWNNGVLNYAAEASPDYAQVVDMIRDADPGQYIPLFREFKTFDERYRKLATDAKSGNLVKRLRGSGRRIKNPIESMIGQARALVLKSQQKRILDQIIRIADNVEGLGHLIFEVQPDQVPGAARDVESLMAEVARKMEKEGVSEQLQERMEELRQGIEQESIAETMLTFFVPAQTPKAGEDPIIPIFHNGKRRWFEVSRDVYEAINGMEIYRMPRILDLFLGVPARSLRLGTTGLRASFSLVTNPLRDYRTLQVNSVTSATSRELFFEWIRQIGAGLLDAASGGALRSEWIDLYNRLGGEMATPLGQDTQPTKRATDRLFQGRIVRTVDPSNWLDFVRNSFQFPEKAARIAEMKFLARDMGWSLDMPLDAETATRLIVAAKQVTTDFTAAGNVGRVLNQALPFFNAQIQGPRAHVRAAQRDPGKFAIRALMGTAVALATWWRYKDEDWWREMPMSEKYRYTYIPFDAPDGRKELIRIPRAFELDGVFMAAPQAMADAWYQERPEEMKDWMGQFMSGFEPSLPPLAEDIFEQAKNEDLFFESPIVPRSQEGLPPEEQFSDYTSTMAIKLGDLTGKSPRRIEHSVRNMFGGLGTDIMAVFGRGEAGDGGQSEKELADLPVVGTLFQRGGRAPRGAKSVDALYERLDMAKMRQRSKREEETEDERQLRLQLSDAAKALSYLSDVRNLEWGVEKRRKINALRVEMAREAVNDFDAEEVNREKFKAWRKEWAALAEEAENSSSMSR